MPDKKNNIYEFVRNLAVTKLECNIFRKLHIIYNCESCSSKRESKYGPMDIPNKLYSWTIDDYLQRRHIDNYVWLDVLKRDITADCLQSLKLKNDLVEVLRYMKLLFNALIASDGTREICIQKNVVNPIREAFEFLNIAETTLQEKEHNEIVLKAYKHKKTIVNETKHDAKYEDLKLQLEGDLVNNDISFPIEIRYQLRNLQNNVYQVQHKYESDEEKCSNEIEMYLAMQNTEKYCSQCVMNMYYAQIENFKNRIVDFNKLYDIEFEEVENQLSYKKLSLEKLREQRKFFKEEMKRFREEILHVEQMAIAAEELRKQKELEALEARALAAKKKADKKNKNANKKK